MLSEDIHGYVRIIQGVMLGYRRIYGDIWVIEGYTGAIPGYVLVGFGVLGSELRDLELRNIAAVNISVH